MFFSNILSEIVGSIRQLATPILILIFADYASGFIIVNAYLSKYGIAQVDLFRPAFISAGILFLLVNLIASLFSVPIATLFLYLIDIANKSTSQLEDGRYWLDTRIESFLFSPTQTPKGPPLSPRVRFFVSIFIVIVSLAMCYRGIPFTEKWASQFTSLLLNLATRDALVSQEQLSGLLTPIMLLQGTSAMLVLIFVFGRAKLGEFSQSVSMALSSLFFIFVQIYTLLSMAGNVYDKLPPSIGGGQPESVILFVNKNDAIYLDQIDNGFKDSDGVVSENTKIINPSTKLDVAQMPTKELILLWQLSNTNTLGQGSLLGYYVRPKKCDTCPIIFVDKTIVYSVIYLKSSNSSNNP